MINNDQSGTSIILLLINLGLLEALKHNLITNDDAEKLLYKPARMSLLEDNGYPQYLIDLIHNGTELENVKRIVSQEAYLRSIERAVKVTSSNLMQLSGVIDEAIDVLVKIIEA